MDIVMISSVGLNAIASILFNRDDVDGIAQSTIKSCDPNSATDRMTNQESTGESVRWTLAYKDDLEEVYGPQVKVDNLWIQNIKATCEKDEKCIQCLKPTFETGEDGILHTFWKFADHFDTGLCIHMDKLPILQEVVEVCETFELNPYMLPARGIGLLLVPNGMRFIDEFVEKHPEYEGCLAHVGYTTEGRERVVIQRGEKRFLVPPERGWC